MHEGIPVYRVERFTEKPGPEKARQFLASGRYLWNSGMFIWRADLIYRLIEEHCWKVSSKVAQVNLPCFQVKEKCRNGQREATTPGNRGRQSAW
ncbi:sugar phosphate nucleotidyltransferase [Desulfofundulus kuznetsovii]|uniref:sugar phosphate nucleotidyltransferase n=1 Tax=Desulfofundulus kuznetsovii TaxID=58135 RepID=UPI00059DF2A7